MPEENVKKVLRSPICVVVGHVDHGKSSILDKIRGTFITSTEEGGITQEIGASLIPSLTIKEVCKDLLKNIQIKFDIPGLLFIDTPGHAAFQSLRRRGGNLADIAILVVDVNEGFKPQTVESINILKEYKTPFIVAANKIDLIPGWVSHKGALLPSIKNQGESVQRELDARLYNLVSSLYELGFESERFDRVSDYSKQVAIVPVSAKTGEGIPELIMALTGLTQKYLASTLKVDLGGRAKGTILEVKEEPGFGETLNVILYDGILRKKDKVIIGTLGEPVVAKIKALLQPLPLNEMRDKHAKFKSVDEVKAAAGVKLVVSSDEKLFAGMPLYSVEEGEDIDKLKEKIKSEVGDVVFSNDKEGIIIKADSLGSLEGLSFMLKNEGIPIRSASLGQITKKDIINAESNDDEKYRVILGFNTTSTKEADAYFDKNKNNKKGIKRITGRVIYKILDEYKDYVKEMEKEKVNEELANLTRPFKIKILPQFIFRQSNPAIVGVEVELGTLKANKKLMNNKGIQVCSVKAIQVEKKNVESAEEGKQVAVSLEGITIGRQVSKNETLYSFLTEEEFRKLKDLRKYLTKSEIQVLKEISEIMRKSNPVWGV